MTTKREFPSDFSDLIAAFAAESVEYLVVGAYAVGAHGRPRATKDLDLWIAGGPNLARVARALARFGLSAAMVAAAETLGDREVLFFGQKPTRVDLIRHIDGVTFAAARSRATTCTLGQQSNVPLISLDDLITTKKAAGRPQDLADVAALLRIRSRGQPT